MGNDDVKYETAITVPENRRISDLIYTVRNTQVMLDSDLAELYQVETGALNRAVKRNNRRFPADFMFQLTAEEFENLKCQFGISSLERYDVTHGGRRTLPFVYSEHGISMLSSVLRSETAITVSIGIIRTFIEMRRFIANNALMFERISAVELKQLELQKSTDEKFKRVFEYIDRGNEPAQRVFFDGQIYDAFSLLVDIISKANSEIILIDGYVDTDTLNILRKKKLGVNVRLYTFPKLLLSQGDVAKFNSQYPTLKVATTVKFHDRFLILDGITAYHIGASLKDAGKKSFAISLLQDNHMVKDILARL